MGLARDSWKERLVEINTAEIDITWNFGHIIVQKHWILQLFIVPSRFTEDITLFLLAK